MNRGVWGPYFGNLSFGFAGSSRQFTEVDGIFAHTSVIPYELAWLRLFVLPK